MSTKTHERKMLRTDWQELPINKELSEIVLQLANARNRLLNWYEAIPDRATYEENGEDVETASQHLLDAIVGISMGILGNEMAGQLTSTK